MKSKCGLIPIQAGKNSVLSSFLCLTFLIVHGCHIHRVAFLPSLNALQDPFIVSAFQSLVHNPHQQQNKHPNKKKKTKIGAPEDAVIQTDRYCCKYRKLFLHCITILRGHSTFNPFDITVTHPLQIYKMFNCLNRSNILM